MSGTGHGSPHGARIPLTTKPNALTRDPDTLECPPGVDDESFEDQVVCTVICPVRVLVKSVFKFS